MIRIKNIRTEIKENIDIYELASKKLRVSKEKNDEVIIHKKSIDARSKMMFAYFFDLDVKISNEEKYLRNDVVKVENEDYVLPKRGNVFNLPSLNVPAPPSPNCTLLFNLKLLFCHKSSTVFILSSIFSPRSNIICL